MMFSTRSTSCGIPGCRVVHGLYPDMEHGLMALTDKEFEELSAIFKGVTGKELTRKLLVEATP